MTDDVSRILAADLHDADVVVESSLRPRNLDEYIGQREVKANLSILLTAAQARGEAADHVLLYGPPGLGKTTLATIIARELGVNVRYTSGPAVERPGDLAAVLTSLEERDVLFIDEIHRLNRAVEEILYPAMEDYALDVMIGKGPSARQPPAEPQAVHGHRRDDARGTDLVAAARPVRRDLPARLLRGSRAHRDRRALGADPGHRDRSRGRGGDRPPRPRHAADREPAAQAGARPRRGHRQRAGSTSRRRSRRCASSRSTTPASTRPTASCWPRSSRSSPRARSAWRPSPPCCPRRSRRSRTSTSRTCCGSASSTGRRRAGSPPRRRATHLAGLGYEIPPPRRAEPDILPLWDEPARAVGGT